MNRRLSSVFLLCLAVSWGCSTDKKADAAQPITQKEGSVPPRPAVIGAPTQPYRPIAVTSGARLSGTVEFDGPFPSDSVIRLSPSTPGCGQSLVDRSVDRTGTRIGGAVVWITDIRSGKPLPLERRFELSNHDCLLDPRVQAVFAPATLNVGSEDVAMHRNRIINVATGETEAIAPFNDNGEVIPFDRLLTKPSQLEITCDLHPWSRAWILVFDHPYYSVTARTGAFSIEDIPAGTYRIRAWHPVLGVADQTVTLAAGQAGSLSLKLAAPSATPPVAQPESASKATS